MQKKFFIIVSGPTGVGKTDFVDKLGAELPFPIEIINADVGQFYMPLSVGTAKPDYESAPVRHHFFDIISQPGDLTVIEFRQRLIAAMQDMWNRSVTPVIVGGSGFYLHSIFFPPQMAQESLAGLKNNSVVLPEELVNLPLAELWKQLHAIDPERAQSIHPHDRYRIERALILWNEGRKPSTVVPFFESPGTYAFYFLTRERDDLYERIDARVEVMLNSGWLDEVKNLDVSWKAFLLKKKLIGYPDIIAFLERSNMSKSSHSEDFGEVVSQIKRKTRAYAKRQLTYWRMLRKKLEQHDPKGAYLKKVSEVNLTLLPLDLYIEQVRRELSSLTGTLVDIGKKAHEHDE